MFKFGGSSDSTNSSILDEFEVSDILAKSIEIKGVTVVKFGLYESRINAECTSVVKSIAFASEVANGRNRF